MSTVQSVAKQIQVALRDGSGAAAHVGCLDYSELVAPNGAPPVSDVSFTYDGNYNGPALDPVNLNYKSRGQRRFDLPSALAKPALFRVFSEGLPGEWGRDQLHRAYVETVKMNDMQLLAWLSAGGIGRVVPNAAEDRRPPATGGAPDASQGGRACGALFFHIKHIGDELPLPDARQLDEVRAKMLRQRGDLTARLDDRELTASIVHGGARPKTTYFDVSGKLGKPNTHYIVKFNMDHDTYNNARIERGTLELARKAGIHAVSSKVVRMRNDSKSVTDLFLTQRYDRQTDHQGSDVRRHRLSAFALTNPEKIHSKEAGDYRDVFAAVRQVSAKPDEDAAELFRRMLFNIGVNNTDDHLKNTEMVYLGVVEGWRLGPAFDLTPTPFPYPHKASIAGLSNGSLKDDAVLYCAERLGIAPAAGLRMRDDVVAALLAWRTVFEHYEVEESDMAIMQSALDQSGVAAEKRYEFGKSFPDPLLPIRSAFSKDTA